MDKISGYSNDDLVVKILSFLPTKVAVSTSVLSKQWKFLWTRVPKLYYNDTIMNSNCSKSMRRFVATNLPLHRAPVIESLYLKLHHPSFHPEDIKLWVGIAVSRHVCELSINYFGRKGKLYAILPSSLYTCKSLVTLKLIHWILVDVPHVISLPSLKTLYLLRVKYADGESLQRFLSNCHVLEDLIVELCEDDNVRKFVVILPSLLNFEIYCSPTCHGYVIDTPSLKYFIARDNSQSSSFYIVNMPKVEKADIHFDGFSDIEKLLKPVTSVKRLSLFLTDNNAEAVYGNNIIFDDLEHLKFSIGNTNWSKLLLWFLKSSPKLRDFEFTGKFSRGVMESVDTSVCWKQLVYIPQCLLSSLQTFKWTCYINPSGEGRDMAIYILKNSCRLKTATFLTKPSLNPKNKLELMKELELSPRGSSTCNLILVEGSNHSLGSTKEA